VYPVNYCWNTAELPEEDTVRIKQINPMNVCQRQSRQSEDCAKSEALLPNKLVQDSDTVFERFEAANKAKTHIASHLPVSFLRSECFHTLDSNTPLKRALYTSEELLQSLEQEEYWKLVDVRILYKLKSELIHLESAIRRSRRIWEGMPLIPVRLSIDL